MQDPSVGSDRGLKKRKLSKDAKPTFDPKKRNSTSGSSKGTRSQPKSSGKSVQSEEPVFEVADSDLPHDQEGNLGDNKDEPRNETDSRRDWFKKPTPPQEPTDPDWNVGKTTQEDYALWDIIENGNSFNPLAQTTTNADGTSTSTIPDPITTEEKTQKKNDVKARNLDSMSFDDLYNNFKIVEQEVKRTVTSSSNSGSQNMAFVSTPSSTNEVNTTNVQVSTANSTVSTDSTLDSTTNLSDDDHDPFEIWPVGLESLNSACTKH
ncbi:hypothetical protein Tco_0278493 [Tanacetum coccineum]